MVALQQQAAAAPFYNIRTAGAIDPLLQMLLLILGQREPVVVQQVAGNRHPVAGHDGPTEPTLEVKLRDALRAELRVIIVIGHVVRLHDVLLGRAHGSVLVAAKLALPDALVVPELVGRLV